MYDVFVLSCDSYFFLFTCVLVLDTFSVLSLIPIVSARFWIFRHSISYFCLAACFVYLICAGLAVLVLT
ncbi:hypothetical protein BDR07DRAFT_1418141 [Suillus spraguei]|nr:hypothetical protein BDR07DRAFT_1418141 [Suillus spraguei]